MPFCPPGEGKALPEGAGAGLGCQERTAPGMEHREAQEPDLWARRLKSPCLHLCQETTASAHRPPRFLTRRLDHREKGIRVPGRCAAWWTGGWELCRRC